MTDSEHARDGTIRPGEAAVAVPDQADAGIWFIGRIRTPWLIRSACPRRGDPADGPVCEIAVDPRWEQALTGIEAHPRLQVLYWMHEARRDLVLQTPRGGAVHGTFALRSPVRPNPVASSVVSLVRRVGTVLFVRGLDCLDGTPLVDLKPDRGVAEV